MHLITPVKTYGWWWELKGRYRLVCVGFWYIEVDSLSPWHVTRTSRKAISVFLFLNGKLYTSALSVKMFMDGTQFFLAIWGQMTNVSSTH